MDPKARQSYNYCRPCWGTAQVSKQACCQWDAFSVQQHFLIIRVDFSVGMREGTLPRLGCRVAADSGTSVPEWFSWRLFRCHELEELFSVASWAVENKDHFSKVNYRSLSQFAKLVWGDMLTVLGLLLSFFHLSDFDCLAGTHIQSHTNSVSIQVWAVHLALVSKPAPTGTRSVMAIEIYRSYLRTQPSIHPPAFLFSHHIWLRLFAFQLCFWEEHWFLVGTFNFFPCTIISNGLIFFLVEFKGNLICTESEGQEGWEQRNQKEDKIRELLAGSGSHEVTHTVWTRCG